ncbi:hypothetical protein H0H81_012320 [Sphagnurus paluster]|uniref:Uncharacterized protein n=1 Tax=Sphagnurus paluster TaxID=117069 RepID=A0A9P7GIN4_9AGAR|nr:hypothetical protein H0H81_012320 [Sphagnurus paluster]
MKKRKGNAKSNDPGKVDDGQPSLWRAPLPCDVPPDLETFDKLCTFCELQGWDCYIVAQDSPANNGKIIGTLGAKMEELEAKVNRMDNEIERRVNERVTEMMGRLVHEIEGRFLTTEVNFKNLDDDVGLLWPVIEDFEEKIPALSATYEEFGQRITTLEAAQEQRQGRPSPGRADMDHGRSHSHSQNRLPTYTPFRTSGTDRTISADPDKSAHVAVLTVPILTNKPADAVTQADSANAVYMAEHVAYPHNAEPAQGTETSATKNLTPYIDVANAYPASPEVSAHPADLVPGRSTSNVIQNRLHSPLHYANLITPLPMGSVTVTSSTTPVNLSLLAAPVMRSQQGGSSLRPSPQPDHQHQAFSRTASPTSEISQTEAIGNMRDSAPATKRRRRKM